MLRLFSIEELFSLTDKPPTCLAVGVFDGVHRGHARLLERTRERAHSPAGGGPPMRTAALTFQNNPLTLLRPMEAPPRLSTIHRRLDWIEESGIDVALALRFDENLARTEPLTFLRDIVARGFRTRLMLCGPDFRFGHLGAGNAGFVRKVGPELGVEIEEVPPLLHLDEPISSSRIRRLVIEGHMEEAAELLGRPYEIEGTVVEGKKRGRQIGYPTANLRAGSHITLPRTGVYVVKIDTPTESYGGMMNVGYSPTFGDIEEVRLEAHLFDFSGDLMGKTLRVRVLRFLREEKRFPSVEELVEEIRRDESASRAVLDGLKTHGSRTA